ncbi:MAG TPA: hypothetical protein VD813_07140 [Pseudonocardia sp.]|nr:hypothetical protein [Pseudonocardia sp.]
MNRVSHRTAATAPRRRLPGWARVALVAPVVLAAALSGCAGPPDPGPPAAAVAEPAAAAYGRTVESVGRVSGTDALVGVVVQGDEVVAYVCDGPAALGERFFGTLDGDRAVLTSAGGARLELTLSGATATGTFTPAGGEPAPFTAEPGGAGAGVYFADGIERGAAVHAGWIVLPDGTQTGTLTRAGQKTTAPAVDPKRVRSRRPAPAPAPTTTTAAAPTADPGLKRVEAEPARLRRVADDPAIVARLCSTRPDRCPA